MSVLADHRTATAPRPSTDGVMCDGLPRQAAGPRFRFSQPNPVAPGRSFARSLFEDLPYMIGVLVRCELGLTMAEWDCLVVGGVALDVTGPGEFRVPFTLDVIASPPHRAGQPPEGVCGDCWGTGHDIDTDASMTGVIGGVFRCFCAGVWV